MPDSRGPSPAMTMRQRLWVTLKGHWYYARRKLKTLGVEVRTGETVEDVRDDAREDAEAVRRAYRIALAREPTSAELEDALAFLRQQEATYPPERRREAALTDFCQVLLCLNEFIYVD